MAGFGDKLKRERESWDTPLADVARRTRIGIQYLEALERGDFDGLPGPRGFGKLYIRVYAKLFGFDPEPVISEYDRQRLEHELRNDADSRVKPERPRRVRFVPRARRSSASERRTPTPEPLVEEPVPDPAALPMQAAEPVVPFIDPRDADTVASTEAVAMSAVSAVPSEPDPVPDVGPTEPSGPPVTQTWASMTGGSPSWKRRIAGGAVALVVLGAFGVILKMRTSRPVDPAVPEPPAATGSVTPSADARLERDGAQIGEDTADHGSVRAPLAASLVKPTAPVSHDPPLVSAAPAVATPGTADSRPLEVSEFELGTGVANHRMVGVRRDFEEGTVASFLTRVRGGAPGRTVHHAWIREGRLVQRIELRLGSLNWRTYSKKTLWGTGDWAVEARDQNGRVLARIEFRCMPASGPGSGS